MAVFCSLRAGLLLNSFFFLLWCFGLWKRVNIKAAPSSSCNAIIPSSIWPFNIFSWRVAKCIGWCGLLCSGSGFELAGACPLRAGRQPLGRAVAQLLFWCHLITSAPCDCGGGYCRMATVSLSPHTPNLSIKYLLCAGEGQILLTETAWRQWRLCGGEGDPGGFWEPPLLILPKLCYWCLAEFHILKGPTRYVLMLL